MRPIMVKKHPRSADVLIVEVPVEGNDDMREVRHLATLNTELHGYVIRRDRMDEFRAWADGIGWTLVDGHAHHGIPKAGHRTWPQECSHCAQPGTLENPPRFCPACGEPWEPITPHDIEHNEPITLTVCDACGHRQPGRFPRCGHCGTLMHYERPTVVPHPHPERNTEPQRLGDLVGNVIADLNSRRTMGTTLPPRLPPTHVDGRPINDVHLPPQPTEPAEPETPEPRKEPEF